MLDKLEVVFGSLKSHEVKYVVIGGVAAVLHGVPRATFDVDLLIDPTPANARKLLDALLDAGLGTAAMTTPEDILANEITVFKDWVRIDVLTSAPGMPFDRAWTGRQTMTYGGREFFVISREDLIASKRASGREIDLQDVRSLDQ